MHKEQYRLYEAGEKTDIYPNYGASIAEATQIKLISLENTRPSERPTLAQIQSTIRSPRSIQE